MRHLYTWIVLIATLTSSALGADGIWTNTSGGTWSTAGNWSGGVVANGSDATADFSTLNITANPTVTLDTARTIGNLIFGDAVTASNDWTVSGANTLTLASSGTPTINVVNRTVTISSVVATSVGFTKTGIGTLVFTGNNTAITGTVTIGGGQLTLSGNGRLNAEFAGQSGQPTLVIEGGGSVLLDSSVNNFSDRIPSNNTTTLRGGSLSLISNSSGTFETINPVFGTGFSTISLDAPSSQQVTLFFNSAPTRSVGATALFRGDTLGADAGFNVSQIKGNTSSIFPTLSNGSPSGGTGTSAGIVPYLIGDATLTGNGTDFVTYVQTSSGASSVDGYKPLDATNYVTSFASGNNVKLSSAASTATLTINALNLTNTGTGTVATINSGETLTLSTGALISAGSVANTINGGNLTAGVNSVTSRELILHVVSGLTVNSAIVDQSGNAVKLVKSSGGTLTLNGTNSYGGGTWINAGTLQVTNDGNLGAASGAITITGGTLQTLGTFATGRGITLNAGTNTFNINAGTTLTENGAIGGTGGLTMATGTGTLVLGASNSFTGGINLNAGTLSVSTDSNLGGAGGGLTLAGGTLNPTASFSTARGIVLSSGTINVNSGATFTTQGTISGTGGLTKAGGTGTLALTGTNTFSGGTFLNAGTLGITSDAALGAVPGAAATNLTFGGNATLQLTSGAGAVSLSSTRNIAIGNTFTGTFDSNGAGNTLTVGGVISGTTGNLAKVGAGMLTVGIGNTYTGTTTISEGTLSAGDLTVGAGISSLGNATSAVSIGGASTAGTLLYTGANDTMTRGITLGAGGGTVNVSTGATTLIVSGKVTGGALGKDGPGILTLSNSTNDYTGATTVLGGTLKAGVATTAFGNLSAVTVNSGATLDMASLSQTIGSLAGAGNVTIGSSGIFLTTGGNNTSTTFSGNLSGGGGLIKNGSGVLTMSGNNNYSGSTTVNGGTLRAGSATGFTPNNTYTLAANTTLDLNNNNVSIDALTSGASTSAVSFGSGTLSLTGVSGSFLTFAGAISGTGGLNVGGIGKFTLSGTNNTYSGPTLVNTTGASTGFAANAVNALSAASAHTVNGSATLFLNNFNNAIGSLAGNGTVSLGSGTLTTGGDNSSTTFSGAIGGTGGVTKVGAGAFVLTGSNGYSGSTTINGGTLSIANNGNIGSGSLALGGGTLNTTASMVLSRATTLNAGTNSFNVASGTTLEITGAINGSGGLTVAVGTGALKLTGTKAFGGGVTMNSGVVQVAADDSLGTAGTALAFGGGTLNSTTSFTSNRPITLNAGTNTFDVNSATTLTEQGDIGGTGGFVKQGAGTLILSGANSYSGPTTVSAGILQASSSAALGSNSAVTVNGTLDLNNNNIAVGSLTGAGTVTLGSGVLTLGGDNTTSSFSGSIGGSGGVTKTGSGTFTLGGTNNYTGATTINSGTLAAGADQNLGTGNLRIASGTTFASIGTFANSRATELIGGVGTIEVVGSPTTLTLNSGIIGAGDLFKSGVGTLALGGTSSYLGDTTIGAGTLSLITGGSIASNLVTVNSTGTFDVTGAGYTVSTGKRLVNNGIVNGPLTLSGGTISGSGTFNGDLTIGNSSVISPGNSPGTMGTAAQTWAGGGIYKWEIDQASRTLGAGKGVDAGYDWINMSGALSVSATSASPFVIDITGLSHGSHSMGAVAGFDEARAYQWTIATSSSGINNFDVSKFTLDATDFTNNNSIGAGGAFSITTVGNDVRLVFTPGPNQSTLFFGATPQTINGATSTTSAPVAFGRVMQNSIQTSNVTLNRVGQSTDYTMAIAGDASSNATSPTEFNNPTTSQNIDVTLNTGNSGARVGSLTIHNLATTSAADGQGSADGDDMVSVTGTVLTNRDISQSGPAVNLGKAFVGLNTATGSAVLSGGPQDDNNATRVDINAGNVAAGGVTVTYTSGSDSRFDSANETKSVAMVGNFAVSGSKSGSVNVASLLSNGEAGAVGATLDTSAPVLYSAEIFQVASLSSSAAGLNLSIANANTSDGGQRASAKIVSRGISQGDTNSWSVTNFNVGTAIAQNTTENGVAAFNQPGKLNGTHRAIFSVALEHEDQTISGASPGDLGSRQFALQQVVAGNVDGGTATVLAGQDYGNITTGFNSVESGNLHTAATLLHGAAAAERNIAMSFDAADHSLSDVVTLTGTGNDVFVLQLTYPDKPGQESDLFLASRDPGGPWLNAIAGNSGGTAFAAGNISYVDYIAGFGGNLTAANLGAYGRDEAANVAWAILNHNSQFAVVVNIPGDFNGDGSVDAADYVYLRKQYSDITTGAGLTAYQTWRTNFGRSISGAGNAATNTAVPEPAALLLLTIAAMSICAGSRGSRT
jgi:fibronectin-binding autotransporter adhesin